MKLENCGIYGGRVGLAMLMVLAVAGSTTAQEKTLRLWPGTPPGKIGAKGAELDTTGENGREVAGRRVIRLGNVSEPMLTVYPAPKETATGTAVVVCPGGGYNILAYDLEGSEVCEWFQSIGVTGILLKYRVPRVEGAPKLPLEPLQDAQRAIGMVRHHAPEWSINPDRIGVLGFSAGGNLAARVSTNYTQRTYEAVDKADELSCRPNFAVLVYPAYLYDPKAPDDQLLVPEIAVDKNTPPMFLTMAFDDRVGPENILRMGIALKRADVPAEVHLYPDGGHGYGLRDAETDAVSWPARCEDWMRHNGWIK